MTELLVEVSFQHPVLAVEVWAVEVSYLLIEFVTESLVVAEVGADAWAEKLIAGIEY